MSESLTAYNLDDIRDMVGYGASGAQAEWTPKEPNWVRIRRTGGALNHLDELEGGTTEEHEFAGIDGVADRKLAEFAVGDFERVALMVRTREKVAEKGDEFRRTPDDGERFKVIGVHIPRVGGVPVCFNYMLERLAR